MRRTTLATTPRRQPCKHFVYDLPVNKAVICWRYVAAAAAAEEPEVTQTPALIPDETSEPRSESEEDSDEDDEHDETVTVTSAADEATSHAQLSTGEPLT